MRRCELLLLVGGIVTTGRALRAEQKAMPVIGYLSGGSQKSNDIPDRPIAFRGFGLIPAGDPNGRNDEHGEVKLTMSNRCLRLPRG
jgi:hypothetical protein